MKRLVFSAALVAALTLASCSSDEGDEAALNGEPVAAVPAPAGSAWAANAVRTEKGGWQVGNPAAPIKLIEYGSLTCPACAAFSSQGSAQLHENYIETGKVSFEFRSVPLHGWTDLLLTRLLECAPVTAAVPLADQVWGNHQAIMTNIQSGFGQGEAALSLPENQRFVAMAQSVGFIDFFASRGISADQAQVCLADNAAVTALADKTSAASEEDDVQGTPTFYLNGQKLTDTSWVAIEAALQRAGAR